MSQYSNFILKLAFFFSSRLMLPLLLKKQRCVMRMSLISPEMFVIASSLDWTGQNQEDMDRKLDRK